MSHTLETLMQLADDYATLTADIPATTEARAALSTALQEVLAERDQMRIEWEVNRAGEALLKAERDAAHMDAVRYRWLRDVPWGYMPEMVSVIQLQQNSKWDAAIDSAMKGQTHD